MTRKSLFPLDLCSYFPAALDDTAPPTPLVIHVWANEFVRQAKQLLMKGVEVGTWRALRPAHHIKATLW